MLRLPSVKTRRETADERGAVLVITLLVMLFLFIFAAFAIDAGIWFVHDRHLQTEADAAAFAGAQVMAQGYENGICSDTSVNSTIAQYDGSQTPVAGQQLPANQQVGASTYATTYSATANNLFDQINVANFKNQTIPGDTGLTGSACADAAVDVKMTETNVSSFLTPIHPAYINKQARVRAETVSQGGAAPFVLPSISTPTDAAVFVVAENATTPALSTDAILAKLGACADNGNVAPCLTSSNSFATWTANGVSVPFTGTPASLVVAKSTAAIAASAVSNVTGGASLVTFCTSSSVTCYDQTDGTGLTYTRTYTATPANFPTAAPIVRDTAISDAPTDPAPCQNAGSTGLFTGFMTASTACNLNFSANMDFGTESCAALTGTGGNNLAATLTVTASSGASASLTCPNPGSSTPSSATGNWTSASTLSVPATTGPVKFDLTWARTGGGTAVPRGTWEQGGFTSGAQNGQCGGGHQCTADFKIVQRIFTGAYDQNSAGASNSGSIAGAALTSTAGELMSAPANTTVPNLGVTIDFQALYDTTAGAGGYVPNGSFSDIAYGTQQGNGLADCGQGVNSATAANGYDVQENAIAGLFTCTTFPVIPFPGTCGGANACPNTVPGGKFLKWLDAGLAARIYGCSEIGPPGGVGRDGCGTMTVAQCKVAPNYWSTQNLMSSLLSNSSDPRLLSVMVTDPGNLKNGNTTVPVRHYAEFYVTGWTGDPCSGLPVSGKNTSKGLYYVSADTAPTNAAGDIFLVGHFVKYFQPSATGSGSTCVLSSIDNCTLVLTR